MYSHGLKIDRLVSVAGKKEPSLIPQPGRNKQCIEDPIATLRSHTRFQHDALEKTSTAQALMSPAITLERYVENLVIWAVAWQMIEHWLSKSPFAKEVPQLVPLPKAWLAEADLAYLYSHSRLQRYHKPSYQSAIETFNSQPVNLSGFIGVCYVIVGALLGNAFIAKHLEATLSLKAEGGAAFFSKRSGDDLSWSQWIRAANKVLSIADDVDAACLWASATFKLIQTMFSGSEYIAVDNTLGIPEANPAGTWMNRQ